MYYGFLCILELGSINQTLQENQVVPHRAKHSCPLFVTNSGCWGLSISVLPTMLPNLEIMSKLTNA
jgi:hypothetical protein